MKKDEKVNLKVINCENKFKKEDKKNITEKTHKEIVNFLHNQINHIDNPENKFPPLKSAFLIFVHEEEGNNLDPFTFSSFDLNLKDFIYIFEKIKMTYLLKNIEDEEEYYE